MAFAIATIVIECRMIESRSGKSASERNSSRMVEGVGAKMSPEGLDTAIANTNLQNMDSLAFDRS